MLSACCDASVERGRLPEAHTQIWSCPLLGDAAPPYKCFGGGQETNPALRESFPFRPKLYPGKNREYLKPYEQLLKYCLRQTGTSYREEYE